MKVTTLSLLAAIGLGASVAHAQSSILIDFGQFAKRHSVGVSDANGNNWSHVTGASDAIADLPDTDGAATGIGLTVAAFTGPGSYNDGLTPNAALGDFAFPDVTDDALFFVDSLSPTLTFSGMNDSLSYELTFYGSRVTTSSRETTYAVGGDSVALQTSGTGIASDGSNWNDDTTVTLLASSSGGGMVVDLSATGGFGYINAMSVTAIPEPGVLSALFGLFAIAGAALRRRSN